MTYAFWNACPDNIVESALRKKSEGREMEVRSPLFTLKQRRKGEGEGQRSWGRAKAETTEFSDCLDTVTDG